MKKIIILFSLICVSVYAWSDVFTILPTDDMYTDADHPGVTPVVTELWTANFSTAGHFERIMIKFDLSDYIGHNADSAILHFTRFFSCPSSGTTAATFYAISENWDENSWDHTQNIQYDSSVSMPYVFSGTGGSAIVDFSVDITNFVNLFLAGSIENNGFLIMANDNQKFSKFYSKEFSNADYHPTLELDIPGVSVENTLPKKVAVLQQNFPNPFNPSTTISFSLNENITEKIELKIMNVKGQIVKTFSNLPITQTIQGGQITNHQLVWDGTDQTGNPVPSGIYFYKMQAGGQYTDTKKMILLK